MTDLIHLNFIKKGTLLLQRPWVPLFIYRTNFGKELFCFSFLINYTKDLHPKKFLITKECKLYLSIYCWEEQTIIQIISPLGKRHEKKKEKFNVTQGMSLLLLKKISLPANLVFHLILFITNPENNIGYEED